MISSAPASVSTMIGREDWALRVETQKRHTQKIPLPLGEGGALKARRVVTSLCKSGDPQLFLRLRPVGLALRTLSQRERMIFSHASDLTLVEHAVLVGRPAARLRFDIHALQIRRDSDTRAGIADEIPPNEILVAPIEWIGERSLDRVRPQQIEELRGAARETVGLILFDCLEDGVLLGCRKFRERHAFRRLGVVVDCRQAGAVDGP